MKYINRFLAIVAIISLVTFVYPRETYAAITLDNSAQGTSGTCNLTKTLSSFTISGSDPGLVVHVLASSAVSASSVTWNGTSLTKVSEVTSGSSVRSSAWILSAPGTGTGDVVATMASAATCNVAAMSFNGLDQTNFFDATSTGTALATTITSTTTTLTDNAVIATLGSRGSAARLLTPSLNGATKVASTTVGTSAFATAYTNALTPTGNYAVKWAQSGTGSANWGQNMLAMKPASGGGGGGGTTQQPPQLPQLWLSMKHTDAFQV